MRGGTDDDGRPYIEEVRPKYIEEWGLFVKLPNGEEQLYAIYGKRKSARRVLDKKRKQYRGSGYRFSVRIITTLSTDIQERDTYENEAGLKTGLAEKVEGYLADALGPETANLIRVTDEDESGPTVSAEIIDIGAKFVIDSIQVEGTGEGTKYRVDYITKDQKVRKYLTPEEWAYLFNLCQDGNVRGNEGPGFQRDDNG